MKNQSLKPNKTKLIAKLMLVVILGMSVLNLSACELKNIFTTTTEDMDGGYGSIVEGGWRADNFGELAVSIKQQFPEGYTFVTFDFENSDEYTANPYYVFFRERLMGNGEVKPFWDTSYIESEVEIRGLGEGNYAIVRFHSPIRNFYNFSNDTVFEIKKSYSDRFLGSVSDYYPKYITSYTYRVYVDETAVIYFEVSASSLELLQEIQSSNYLDFLLEYIVIGG